MVKNWNFRSSLFSHAREAMYYGKYWVLLVFGVMLDNIDPCTKTILTFLVDFDYL